MKLLADEYGKQVKDSQSMLKYSKWFSIIQVPYSTFIPQSS